MNHRPAIRYHTRFFDYYPLARNHEAPSPQDRGLVVRGDGHVALVDWDKGVTFSEEELPLILMLLECYPKVCPYEKVFTLFPQLTSECDAEQSPPSHTTAAVGKTDQQREQLASLRSLLSNISPRLELLGLRVVVVLDLGLLLHPYTPPPAENVLAFGQYRAQRSLKKPQETIER
jgi:hypothetical protein